MKLHRITHPADPLLASLWAIYLDSFPEEERRTVSDHQALLCEPDFHCRVLLDGAKVNGLLCFWDMEKLRYVEHFALAPHARNSGRGSAILRALAAETPEDRLVMLEIDPLTTETACRRLNFYQRLGYVANDPVYMHPPYQKGHTAYPLILLSLQRAMTRKERTEFEDAVLNHVCIVR